jgi:hypothetical protein
MQSLRSDGEKKDVQYWQKGLAAVCDAGIGKLVPRYEKCLNLYGNYVEKYVGVGIKITP